MVYIHQLPDWPDFRWDRDAVLAPLAAVRHRQGRLIGRMEAQKSPLCPRRPPLLLGSTRADVGGSRAYSPRSSVRPSSPPMAMGE